MKKLILALASLMLVTGVASAQVGNASGEATSQPGFANGYAHFNDAFQTITISGDLPGQVSFQLPSANFEIHAGKLNPDTRVRLRIAVHNTSDRAIEVWEVGTGEDGTQTDYVGLFTINAPKIQIASGATRWFIFDIVVPDEDTMEAWFESSSFSPGDLITASTRLRARGILPTNDTRVDAAFD